MSLFGTVRCTRPYYYGPHGRKGFCPFDRTLGLTAHDLTPAADQRACRAGVLGSFAEAAAKVLPKLANRHLAESTVERATEAAGGRVGQARQAGQTFGPAQPWAWHQDAAGKTVASVAVDATGVGQQGPGGAKAEGRRANVAVIYKPVPQDRRQWARPRGRRPAWQGRYLATLEPLGALGIPWRRPAAQLGRERAERWIALSDGGSGLADFRRANFGRVDEVILDCYHGAQQLPDFAKLWRPGAAAAARALAGEWCHQRKQQGGAAVQGLLQGLDRRGRSPAVREAHRQLVGYFANQVHRMD